MKAAQMMIKIAVLTVTVTVIDYFSFFVLYPLQLSRLPFFLYLSCQCVRLRLVKLG